MCLKLQEGKAYLSKKSTRSRTAWSPTAVLATDSLLQPSRSQMLSLKCSSAVKQDWKHLPTRYKGHLKTICLQWIQYVSSHCHCKGQFLAWRDFITQEDILNSKMVSLLRVPWHRYKIWSDSTQVTEALNRRQPSKPETLSDTRK